MDETGVDVPAGTQEEILVSGRNVMTGSWGRPLETAEVLERGRLGGDDIYPAEVEQIIMELAEAESVAIVWVTDARWGEVGRAVVVQMAGSTVGHELITAHLDGRVARYTIPKSAVGVDHLPRTASGKVRKQALRERTGARTNLGRGS